jgi:hypothetical protein
MHHNQTIDWLLGYYVLSAAISAMPAPTASSNPGYVWLFKFSNTLGANIARAYSTAVEKSPNFSDAAKLIGAAPAPEPSKP